MDRDSAGLEREERTRIDLVYSDTRRVGHTVSPRHGELSFTTRRGNNSNLSTKIED